MNPPVKTCCYFDCDKVADLEIWTERLSGGMAGPDPYCDITHACTQHVSGLLSWQPDAINPEEVCWRVIQLRRE